jgi:hypothetical protein
VRKVEVRAENTKLQASIHSYRSVLIVVLATRSNTLRTRDKDQGWRRSRQRIGTSWKATAILATYSFVTPSSSLLPRSTLRTFRRFVNTSSCSKSTSPKSSVQAFSLSSTVALIVLRASQRLGGRVNVGDQTLAASVVDAFMGGQGGELGKIYCGSGLARLSYRSARKNRVL